MAEWKGRTSAFISEKFDKGINGVNALNNIPDGYALDLENVDLSNPGRVAKRAGYHLFGQRLPIRTKRIEVAGDVQRYYFDVVPSISVTVSLFLNTSLNLSATSDALFFRVDDKENTVFATCVTTSTITTDTIFRFIGDDGREHYVQPLVVFSETGTASFLLPIYITTWWTAIGLSDTLATQVPGFLAQGSVLPAITEDLVTGVSVAQTLPYRVRVTYSSSSEASNVLVGASIFFETCIRQAGNLPVRGTVIAKGLEYIDIECETATAFVGSASQEYFRMRYINAKHFRYQSSNYLTDLIGASHVESTTLWKLLIEDCASFSASTTIMQTTGPAASTNEIGFLYGLQINAGAVANVNKYYNVSDGRDRAVAILDGYVFSETDHGTQIMPTISGLTYTGAPTTIVTNRTTKTLSIPLPNADLVYHVDDDISVTYADGTYATGSTGYTTDIFRCSGVTSSALILDADGRNDYYLRANTRWKFTRTSSTVYIKNATANLPILAGMTCQLSVSNALLATYEILDVDYTGAVPFVVLDTDVLWGSDDGLVARPLFVPIPSDLSISYTSQPGTLTDINSVSVERSTVFATGLSGIWRFNGVEMLNMRIPRCGSGFIRNVPGTGGSLQILTNNDGTKSGKLYRFIVTYSYSEFVNGKLIKYESGISAGSVYEILSEQASDKSDFSKFVELQIPCIPRGMGLPADKIRINVYRTPSGYVSGTPTNESYLLERQVDNNPNAPFVTVIAGTEAPLLFTPENYEILATQVASPTATTDDLGREVIDPPLSSIITVISDRIMVAAGYDHPYLHFICKDLYNTADNSFKAHFEIAYKPPQLAEVGYKFMSCPCDYSTTTGTGGAKDVTIGGTGIPFQIIGVDSYEIKQITYTDNSHLFKVTGASFTQDKQYLLRLANGKKEALVEGTSDPYYSGYDFESQVFTATSTSTQLSSQKKWTKVTTSNTVSPPTETFITFEKVGDVNAISTTNGLIIIGNTAKDSTGAIEFLLYTSLSITTNDFIILKGLGTTGQVKDASGKVLSFDKDLVMLVTNGSSPFTLRAHTKGITVSSHFALAALQTAISVSNAATGVIEEPFSIFKLQSGTARATTDWTISPKTATITLITNPSISPSAGDYICIDGLPSEVPPNSGFNYNGTLKVVSYTAGTGTFVVNVTPPDTARGTLSQDFTSEPAKGKLVWTKGGIATGTNVLQVRLKSSTLSVAASAGDFVYLITRGQDYNSFCLALTGFFKVTRVTSDFVTWVSSLAIGATIVGVEIEYYQTLDYFSLTGASYTRCIFASRSGDGINTQIICNVPVPVANYRDGSRDICGSIYAPIDAYTPLERLIKCLSHSLNCVLASYGFSYWGGRSVGNVENVHIGNVIPTNGCKFMPHLHPDNSYKYRYYQGTISSAEFEPQWVVTMQPNCWRVEADSQIDIADTVYTPHTFLSAKEYRPYRLWLTNPSGTLVGQSFRELSYADIQSADGERIVGIAPYQTYCIVAKQNSIWRYIYNESPINKVPGTVGAVSHKNMIPTENGVFFLHATGIYITDGTSTETLYQTQRHFNDRVIQNQLLFPLTSGFHSSLKKTVTIGVPLSDSSDTLAENVTGQFSFNYSTKTITLDALNYGWSINTNIDATAWVGIYNDVFYSSTNGCIKRMRSENTPTRYSDERQAIVMKCHTRFFFSQETIQERFVRSLFFQFGKATAVNMSVNLSWDWFKGYDEMITYNLPVDGFGTAPFGTSYFGSDKFMENRRKTPDRIRAAQMSLEFVDETLDSSGEIYGVYVESTEASTKLINQGNER